MPVRLFGAVVAAAIMTLSAADAAVISSNRSVVASVGSGLISDTDQSAALGLFSGDVSQAVGSEWFAEAAQTTDIAVAGGTLSASGIGTASAGDSFEFGASRSQAASTTLELIFTVEQAGTFSLDGVLSASGSHTAVTVLLRNLTAGTDVFSQTVDGAFIESGALAAGDTYWLFVDTRVTGPVSSAAFLGEVDFVFEFEATGLTAPVAAVPAPPAALAALTGLVLLGRFRRNRRAA